MPYCMVFHIRNAEASGCHHPISKEVFESSLTFVLRWKGENAEQMETENVVQMSHLRLHSLNALIAQ